VLGAELKPGARFILDALDSSSRMRAARAVIVGEGRLDPTTLEGKAAGELATDARQAGVPCHAIVGSTALGAFERRIIDLQTVREAGTVADLERAAQQLALSGVL
jgi:glycerate kinase